ncbi:MAG: preprotein translocase subunit SecA [Gammaproteobacteria bacterium]
MARKLEVDVHFEVKEKERAVSLLEDGIEEAEKLLNVESFYTPGHTDWPHYIENAIRAHALYQRDREYVVENGQVVIVDENTGRKMEGRRWSDGLHQAVETKEAIEVRAENQTLATITLQNYFRGYGKLAGMTGTAITEANEFHRIYGLDVVSIPTNKPIDRDDAVDTVYRTEPEKWNAICDEIERLKKKGQPVLVGTTSVENSERLAGMLRERDVVHEVLNAKAGQIEREASIVAMAGEKDAVTVSTNMAGRGTDIKLGGNFEYRLALALEAAELTQGDVDHLEAIDALRTEVRAKCDADEAVVLSLGGLYVLGTERHESRRIDNQLRGRSGRQGDAGESRFFLSLQDPLMKRFYKDWVTNAMEKLGMKEGVPIESPMVARAIEKAQRKVEDYYFEMRKNLLEYDEVMDEQRKTIYSVRQESLEGVEVREKVVQMFDGVVKRMAATFTDDPEGFGGWFQRWFGFELESSAAERATKDGDADCTPALQAVLDQYVEREEAIGDGPDGDPVMRKVDRHLLLHAIDTKWMDHLRAITALRQGIGLRGYAQRDPKNEYKGEGFKLFEKLLAAVEDEVTSLILRVQVRKPGEEGASPQQAGAALQGQSAAGFTGTPEGAYKGAKNVTKEEAMKAARAVQAARAKQQAKRAPASSAFDSANRMKKMQEAQDVAKAKAENREPAKPEEPKLDLTGVGRNDACPCGSGKKLKKCHGAGEA